MEKKVRKQLEDTPVNRFIMSSASLGSESIKFSMAGVFMFAQALACSGFRYFSWYMRSLQMCIHLPMLQTIVPANVSLFYSSLLPIITFDILDPEWTTQLWFNFDYEKQRMLQDYELDQLEDLGYETHNSILNLGSMWIFAQT